MTGPVEMTILWLERQALKIGQIVSSMEAQLKPVAQQTAQQWAFAIGSNGGPYDAVCGISLPNTLQANWGISAETGGVSQNLSGTFPLTWDGQQYSGSGTLQYPGSFLVYTYLGEQGDAGVAYFLYELVPELNTNYATSTPIWVTAVPPSSSNALWTVTVGQLIATTPTQVFSATHNLHLYGDTGYVDFYAPQSGDGSGSPNYTYSASVGVRCAGWEITGPDNPGIEVAIPVQTNIEPIGQPIQPPTWTTPVQRGWEAAVTITLPPS